MERIMWVDYCYIENGKKVEIYKDFETEEEFMATVKMCQKKGYQYECYDSDWDTENN